MSVKTSTFGSTCLSDEDASKFVRQVKYGRPKAAAVKAAKRGSAMLKEFNSQGFVRISRKSGK